MKRQQQINSASGAKDRSKANNAENTIAGGAQTSQPRNSSQDRLS